MIYLNNINFNTKKEKNKHLTYKMYKKIESEYNHYVSSKSKEIGLTEFKGKLAEMIGTTLSNLYEIIRDGLVSVYNYDLSEIKDKLIIGENTENIRQKYKTYLENLIKCSGNSVHTVLADTDTMLYPCFNSAFIQDKEETVFYKNYCLNNISKVVVYNNNEIENHL